MFWSFRGAAKAASAESIAPDRAGFALVVIMYSGLLAALGPGMTGRDLRRGDSAHAHQRDIVEFGLFGGVLGLALADLVAFVEQLDLLEFLESFRQRQLGVLELGAQFVGGALEILAAPDRGLGVGRIGKVARIVDAGAILLDLDLTLQIGGHALELGDHGLDLRDLAPFLVDLKLLQANKRLTGLHRLLLPRSHSTMAPQKPRAAP